MRYRTEIDGLRAFAVVPVILFHAGFESFSGGYVGVDVFFVISGYLITSIILSEMDEGKFSLINFYERRARRILPALFFVMAVCIPFAWFWLIPRDMEDFAQSLIAVSTFSSNFLFWSESGYFDTAAELKPLLHTWSLAVEEQYYILFPLFMVLTWRLSKRRMLDLLIGMFLISLVIAHWGAYNIPSATFYLLPARGWELLLGVFVAFHFNRGTADDLSSSLKQTLSLTGLLLIIYSVFAYSEQTPFPSLFTLAPTLGTVLLILFTRKGTLAYRILSNRLMVSIGLISYSAYLWHYPLFAFAKHRSLSEPSMPQMALLCAITLLLAYLSWRFIEKPFRIKSELRSASFSILLKSSTVCGLFILTGYLFIGGPLKTKIELDYPDINFNYEKIHKGSRITGKDCSRFKTLEGTVFCKVYGKGDNLVVIWGDSHAYYLRLTLPRKLLPNNTQLIIIAHTGCPPIAGVVRVGKRGYVGNCLSTKTLSAYGDYISSMAPKKIFLVGRWTMYLKGLYKNGSLQSRDHFIASNETSSGSESSARTAFVNGMKKTLNLFRNSDVFVVGQPPEINHLRPKFILENFTTPRSPIDTWHSIESDVFKEIERDHKFEYINTRNHFCDAHECLLKIDNQPIYMDDNHLTGHGLSEEWRLISQKIIQ